MDALITLGGGDMRRTLNILQVGTAAAHIQSMTRTRGICVLATVDMQLGSMLLHTA
jgi:DNA polymerase III delta prime subunit